MYRWPYSEWFDHVGLTPRYRTPDSSKFSGQDNMSTTEHISCFLVQRGEVAIEEPLKVWLFPLSLSCPAFSLFTSLPPNSIYGWANLEKQLHKYFFARVHEMRLTDFSGLGKGTNETISELIEIFCDVWSQCYNLNLNNLNWWKYLFRDCYLMLKRCFLLMNLKD